MRTRHIGPGLRGWRRFDIRRIDDLRNAVLGAEIEPIQMAGPIVTGSLTFSTNDGIIFSSGLINGKVMITGTLSADAITLLVGLRFGAGSRYWLNEVATGDVGMFQPGDDHDALYTAGSLYLAATLTSERLYEEAAREGLALDGRIVGRTGLHPKPIPLSSLARLRDGVVRIHHSGSATIDRRSDVGGAMLRVVINHYACVPSGEDGRTRPTGRAKTVHRAREYIRENLAAPISMDALAEATGASRRTLYRAFSEILEDTPQRYVTRLRLHRIRQAMVSDTEAACTVSVIARRWGLGGDLGRLSGRYRKLFGEYPSATRALQLARRQEGAPL